MKTVLILEDDNIIANHLKLLAKQAKCLKVYIVNSESAAREILTTIDPDYSIVDFYLNNRPLSSTTFEIIKNKTLKRVLVLTSESLCYLKNLIFDDHCEYMRKPFEDYEVVCKLG